MYLSQNNENWENTTPMIHRGLSTIHSILSSAGKFPHHQAEHIIWPSNIKERRK